MVSCDVVVEVFPNTFDAIVVRAIGRQEVQLDMIAPSDLGCVDGLAAVDFEVVQDNMNAAFSTE